MISVSESKNKRIAHRESKAELRAKLKEKIVYEREKEGKKETENAEVGRRTKERLTKSTQGVWLLVCRDDLQEPCSA